MADNDEPPKAPNSDTSHPPVFSKKRKTATRQKKPAKTHAVGAAKLESPFAPSSSAPEPVAPSSSAPNKPEQSTSLSSPSRVSESSRYAIQHHDERMKLNAPESMASESSQSAGKHHGERTELDTCGTPLKREDRGTGEARSKGDERPHEYSNEARVYMARYEYLSKAHDMKRYDECREGCLDLLMIPRLPLWTRVQTLQMVATISYPAHAEHYLQKAADLLDQMGDKWQTLLLKSDNDKMFADLNAWRSKRGLLDQDLHGTDWGDGEDGPVADCFQNKADDVMEPESESQDAQPTLTIRTKDV